MDEASFASIKAASVKNMMNFDSSELPVDRQIEIFKQAVVDLEKFIDDAIEKGRQSKIAAFERTRHP